MHKVNKEPYRVEHSHAGRGSSLAQQLALSRQELQTVQSSQLATCRAGAGMVDLIETSGISFSVVR